MRNISLMIFAKVGSFGGRASYSPKKVLISFYVYLFVVIYVTCFLRNNTNEGLYFIIGHTVGFACVGVFSKIPFCV